MTIPGKKEAYRLFGEDGYSLLDLMIRVGISHRNRGNMSYAITPLTISNVSMSLLQGSFPSIIVSGMGKGYAGRFR